MRALLRQIEHRHQEPERSGRSSRERTSSLSTDGRPFLDFLCSLYVDIALKSCATLTIAPVGSAPRCFPPQSYRDTFGSCPREAWRAAKEQAAYDARMAAIETLPADVVPGSQTSASWPKRSP